MTPKRSFLNYILSLFLLISVPFDLVSQIVTFQKTYGTIDYDFGRAVPTSDSGIIFIGTIHAFQNSQKACVLKLNKYGDTSWVKEYKHPVYTTNAQRHIIELSGGGYFFITVVSSGPSPGAVGVKINSVGDTLFTKNCPASECFFEASDGGIVFFTSNAIIKCDPQLNILWLRHFGGPSEYLDAYGIRTNDNGYFLMAQTQQFACGGPSDFDWIGVKTDSLGNLQWEKVYGTIAFENMGTVQQTFDGGYIMVGNTYVNGGPSNPDVLVIKVDAAGAVQWARTYGGVNEEEALAIRQTPGSPGYIISGTTLGNELLFAGKRAFIYKIDLSGNFQWGKIYGSLNVSSPYRDEIHHAYPLYDGGYLLSGQTQNFGQNLEFDFWVIKTDALGVSGCNEVNTAPQVIIPTVVVSTITATDIPTTWFNSNSIVYSYSGITANLLCGNNIPVSSNYSLTKSKNIVLYPNPNPGVFTVYFPHNFEISCLYIYNSIGLLVYVVECQAVKASFSIALELPNGIYFMVLAGDQFSSTQKFLLQKE